MSLLGGTHPRDARIVFEPVEHKYYVDGEPMEISVTGLVHHWFPQFQPRPQAETMLRNKEFYTNAERYGRYWPLLQDLDLKQGKDFETAVTRVLACWKANGEEASGAGTIMHQAIEDYYREGKPLPETRDCLLFADFHAYMSNLGYLPYRSEQIMWDLDLRLAGSADMLYIHKDDLASLDDPSQPTPVLLADWKRSKEIKKEAIGRDNRYGFGPFSRKANCNYQHYSLQLNIYKHLMQKHYNLQVYLMCLVILHPDQETFQVEEVEDNQEAVEEIFRLRLQENNIRL